jgi:hypothetical protein
MFKFTFPQRFLKRGFHYTLYCGVYRVSTTVNNCGLQIWSLSLLDILFTELLTIITHSDHFNYTEEGLPRLLALLSDVCLALLASLALLALLALICYNRQSDTMAASVFVTAENWSNSISVTYKTPAYVCVVMWTCLQLSRRQWCILCSYRSRFLAKDGRSDSDILAFRLHATVPLIN